MRKVVLPDLGEDIKTAVVSFWHAEAGSEIKKGSDLVEMATDKATFNVPAPVSGKIKERFFEEGDSVNVGDTLAVIEEAG